MIVHLVLREEKGRRALTYPPPGLLLFVDYVLGQAGTLQLLLDPPLLDLSDL